MSRTKVMASIIDDSAGGMKALSSDCPWIVIQQQMPDRFTYAFTNRLDGLCHITVKETEAHDTELNGLNLITPSKMLPESPCPEWGR